MSALPLDSFLKIVASITAVLWCIFAIGNFIRSPAWTRRKHLAHGLSLITVTLTLLTYSLQVRHLPLTNVAEIFVFVGWLYIGLFFIQSMRSQGEPLRSLDFFYAPISTMLVLLGLSFLSSFRSIIALAPSTHAQFEQIFILISMINYFYSMMIALLYARIFKEIQEKKSLFLTLKLPNLRSLKQTLEQFLFMGSASLLLALSVYYLFRPLGFLPPRNLSAKPSGYYLIAGALFTLILIISRFRRIGHRQLIWGMSAGFFFMLLTLFTSV